MEEIDKVYCMECTYYYILSNDCVHENNLDNDYIIKDIDYLNVNNDCKLFKKDEVYDSWK